MANKVIQITSDEAPKKKGLEVYRDISLVADLNQANIYKSYKEVIPMAYLANDIEELSTQYLHGEEMALDFITNGFKIEAQVSDAYYTEDYDTDFEKTMTLLRSEHAPQYQNLSSAVITEESIRQLDKLTQILLLKNEGEVSSFVEWKESKMWNPYKLAKLVNVKAVFNSLHNIFTWTPGERIINPEFGSNLRKLLYEGITDFTSEAIISEIRRCISEYEPRVNVVTIKNASKVDDTENNTIQIDIIFTIPELSREQFIYSYKYNQYDNE